VIPLENHEIQLRRRPGVIAVVWAARLIGAWIVALPVTQLFESSGIGDFPRGDALLFEPGGALLVETLRKGGGALPATLRDSLLLLLLVMFASLLPLALLLVALVHGGRLDRREWLVRAFEHLPPLILLAGAVLLVQSIALGAAAVVAAAARAILYQRLDERSADLITVALFLGGALFVLALGILHDLARAAAVRHRSRATSAIKAGYRALRRRPLAALSGWLVPALWSVAALAAGAILVGRIGVEESGEWRVLAVLGVHQLVMLGLVALRAVWLARALALVGPERDA
jgi:hypothetical protein